MVNIKLHTIIVTIAFLLHSILISQVLDNSRADKESILSALKDPKWEERNRILSTLDSSSIADRDISTALINLLEEETDFYGLGLQSGLKDSDGFVSDGHVEAWGEYYWYLVRVVGKTRNDNAIPVLIKSIFGAGGIDASEALAVFGEISIVALLDEMDINRDIFHEIVSETITLRYVMGGLDKAGVSISPETAERLKHKMIALTTDYSSLPGIRIDAIKVLGHIDDPEVIAHLESLAQSDPYFLPYTIRGIKSEHGGYVIRQEAQKQLEKLREK